MARDAVKPSVLPLGTGLRFLRWKTLLGVLAVAVALVALDYGVAAYQRYTVEEIRKAKLRLERAALFKLRADVAGLALEPDGRYRLAIFVENPFREEPLFVMVPSVQVFVQVGTAWREVPMRPATDQEGRVLKVADRRMFDYVFEQPFKEFEQLIAGYMHMRFLNVMLVSQRSQPGRKDIVERADNYYAYLLPHGADERELLQKNNFPGSRPPVWISMPPH